MSQLTTTQPTHFDCVPLANFAPGDWAGAEAAFANVKSLAFGQHWLPETEPAFRGAQAKVGWRDGHLWLLAELQDDDIFSNATGPNQWTWTLGDALEVFLKPVQQEAYWEMHVSPPNHTLQVRFPSAEAFQELGRINGTLTPYLVTENVMCSWTQVGSGQWRVLASFAIAAIADSGQAAVGDEWLVLFARYDYTRQGDEVGEPVTSASAPMADGHFHTHEYYQTMRFVGEGA